MIRNKDGITLVELLVTIAVIGILAILVAPEIGRFRSNYNVRLCATDLIQNMRLARAMAIKENREYLIVFDTANQRYLIGFDGDDDNNLTTLNSDTFGFCKDTPTFDTDGDGINDRGDGIPDTDADANADGVPDCVKTVNLSDCGNNIIFGYALGTTPPNGPNGAAIPINGIGFFGRPPFVSFSPNGSVSEAGVYTYIQQTTRGYSYAVEVLNTSGTINMWKWDGDRTRPLITTWKEIR